MTNPSDQQDASDSKASSPENSPTVTSSTQLPADFNAAKQVPLSPSPSLGPDLEQIARASSSNVDAALDPYQLRNGISTDQELSALRHRKKKGKAIAKFQDQQNDLINSLLKPMQEHTEDARLEAEDNRLPVKIAIYASMAANLGLCVLQLYAAISSGSFSLLATGIDSIFDIGSNVLLWYLHRKATRLDINKWPVGGARLENIGNIVYGFLMGAVNLVVMVESVRDLVTHNPDSDTNTFHLPSIIAVAAALGVKVLLFFYCLSLRKRSSQVHVLWEDHRNDIFLNGFGVLMSAGGSKLRWWLDPTGAVIIGVGILLTWGRTIYREFELLAGKSAPNEFLKLLTYNAMTFSEDIEKVDTVRAYHSGSQYFVEVDIVMNSNTPLWKAHDASQLLQDLIEALPNVERAFVHVDHEATHTPEHRKVVY
ncbi:CDF-like metal transporter [Lentinula guzmanii]|uniref:CDF-like metal transporter n=1 Tax=Lentinula guzmanii TaxID=2804957 RepID=A0AA38JAL6_9AGAR|nr:CDF-like metal transporter [Lentinula guzmanii]